jgi:hypothetical protein
MNFLRLSLVGILIGPSFAFTLAGAQQPPPATEPTIAASQLTALTVAANPADATHKSVKITFETKPGTQKLPKSFVAMINDQEVQLTSIGRGKYAGIVKMDEPAETVKTQRSRIVNGKVVPPAAGAAPAGATTIVCTIETVECPPNCKSSIFGTRCIICLKITCKVTITTPKL